MYKRITHTFPTRKEAMKIKKEMLEESKENYIVLNVSPIEKIDVSRHGRYYTFNSTVYTDLPDKDIIYYVLGEPTSMERKTR